MMLARTLLYTALSRTPASAFHSGSLLTATEAVFNLCQFLPGSVRSKCNKFFRWPRHFRIQAAQTRPQDHYSVARFLILKARRRHHKSPCRSQPRCFCCIPPHFTYTINGVIQNLYVEHDQQDRRSLFRVEVRGMWAAAQSQ